jgi:hypothetical protein
MINLEVMNLMIQRNKQTRRKRRKIGKGIGRSGMPAHWYVDDATIKLILL